MAPKNKKKKSGTTKKHKPAKPKQKLKAKKTPKKAAAKASPKVRRPAAGYLNEAAPMVKGRGSRTGGQSGDTEGLSDSETVDSESVEELVEEGQDFEAEMVDAVANAPDPDEAELDAEVPEENDQDPDVRSFSKRNRL